MKLKNILRDFQDDDKKMIRFIFRVFNRRSKSLQSVVRDKTTHLKLKTK